MYGYPILMRAGLGNMLVPWAKCHLWCKDHHVRMIAPYWTKLRVGPYLRNERDKRNYQRLFTTGPYIGGLKRLYLLASLQKRPVEQYVDGSDGKGIVVFSGMESFDTLLGRHEEIKKALLAMTKPEFIPPKQDRPFIGIHVRLGDYAPVDGTESAPWTSRLPIDWYVGALQEVRKTLGFELDATVFSDGDNKELMPLLQLSGVHRSDYRESITDILALSQASIIIGSCSSFSMWGAYLAQTFTIWHRGRCPEAVMDRKDSELFETEWLLGEKFPDRLSDGLVNFLGDDGAQRSWKNRKRPQTS